MASSGKFNKLLIITGPTATGKTTLGLDLAGKFNGEILSADSRQVYKYMDIGTGKDTKHFQWGIDLVEPDKPFSVSDWVNYANKILEDVWKREKLPIIVGGTGHYIKELLRPSGTLHIPPNDELRAKLLNCSTVELQSKLQEVDINKWQTMNSSDQNNPRRLVRAIEVVGKKENFLTNNFDSLIIGLTAPFEYLYQRIDQRVDDRIKMGVEPERVRLKKYNLPKTIGYNGESDQEWKFAEHAYARRQLTYLHNQLKNISWVDITSENWHQNVEQIVGRWYIGEDGAKTIKDSI